jgi:hypothetical protein
MEKAKKVFGIVNRLSIILTISATSASITGIPITGFYPGIIVLIILTLIPKASNFYAKKIINKSNVFQRDYYIIFIIINLLTMLVVFWMAFVIMADRVFGELL